MRILIVKPSSLGDIVHAMVVVSELKRQRPDCIIDWVVGDRFFDIVDQSKIAQRVLIYERHGNLSSIFRLISEIRRQNYDYVFDMQGLARSGIMTYFAKSPHKVGRKDSRELSFLAYTETVNYPGPVHAVDILKEFLNTVGCNDEVSGMVPELRNISSPVYREFLESKVPSKDFVCVFPESRGPKKEWEYFGELIPEILTAQPNTSVLLLGSRTNKITDTDSDHFFDLRGQTSLADLVFLIKNARLVVANDSGPLHISAALERPTLGLFTITDPSRSGPYPAYKESNVALRLSNQPSEIGIILQTIVEMLSN